jgi:hypothetical protein
MQTQLPTHLWTLEFLIWNSPFASLLASFGGKADQWGYPISSFAHKKFILALVFFIFYFSVEVEKMAKGGDSCMGCLGLLILFGGIFMVFVSGGLLAIPGFGMLILGTFMLCLPGLSGSICKFMCILLGILAALAFLKSVLKL